MEGVILHESRALEVGSEWDAAVGAVLAGAGCVPPPLETLF